MRKYLTGEEINNLYKKYDTPLNVIRHCKAVSRTAVGIAERLDEHGFDLDIDMIKGACLVHDAARTLARHWDVVADDLAEMGYPEESVIVRNHMTGDGYHDIKDITEQDLIWLGDRLNKEDKYVGIDERFEYIFDKARKFGATEEHMADILKSKKRMQHLMDQIAEVIGCDIDSLFKEEEK
ncbi:MAG: hypothetical protein IIU36_02205 [Firmicutes bacterium]|nr:hypothetical protein [Bacillota bacterium]